jgi:hypothetical protein
MIFYSNKGEKKEEGGWSMLMQVMISPKKFR